jgi:hypothetical protein
MKVNEKVGDHCRNGGEGEKEEKRDEGESPTKGSTAHQPSAGFRGSLALRKVDARRTCSPLCQKEKGAESVKCTVHNFHTPRDESARVPEILGELLRQLIGVPE